MLPGKRSGGGIGRRRCYGKSRHTPCNANPGQGKTRSKEMYGSAMGKAHCSHYGFRSNRNLITAAT